MGEKAHRLFYRPARGGYSWRRLAYATAASRDAAAVTLRAQGYEVERYDVLRLPVDTGSRQTVAAG